MVQATTIRAEPVLFTFTGTSSGFVGSTPFTDALFNIQFFGDTSTVIQPGNGTFGINGSLSTITLGNIGSGSFLDGTRMFALQSGTAGFGMQGGNLVLLLTGPALAGYDLRSSFSPATFATVGEDTLERFRDISTTLGPVDFTSARDVTFSAVIVPEHASLGLLSVAATLLWCLRRRRTAR